MDERYTFVDATCEFEFEVRQAVLTHAAAKPNDGGFAHMCTVCQHADGQVCKRAWVAQHELADALFSRCK